MNISKQAQKAAHQIWDDVEDDGRGKQWIEEIVQHAIDAALIEAGVHEQGLFKDIKVLIEERDNLITGMSHATKRLSEMSALLDNVSHNNPTDIYEDDIKRPCFDNCIACAWAKCKASL